MPIKTFLFLVLISLIQVSWSDDPAEVKSEAKAEQNTMVVVDYNRHNLELVPTAIDSMMKDKENVIAKIDPEKRSATGEFEYLVGSGESDETGEYVLQFEALADFDAAQKRRWQLSNKTGYNIYLVFTAPFYKLRSGNFKSKAKAEEAVASLAASNVTAFIVKVK